MCQFCGKFDPQFDNQAIDMHYWKDCPMLSMCPGCGQITEIAVINEHLIEDCENAHEFSQCPRCKEPISNDEYEQHVDEQLC